MWLPATPQHNVTSCNITAQHCCCTVHKVCSSRNIAKIWQCLIAQQSSSQLSTAYRSVDVAGFSNEHVYGGSVYAGYCSWQQHYITDVQVFNLKFRIYSLRFNLVFSMIVYGAMVKLTCLLPCFAASLMSASCQQGRTVCQHPSSISLTVT